MEECYAILFSKNDKHYFFGSQGHVGVVKNEHQAIKALCRDVAKDRLALSGILTLGVYEIRLARLPMTDEGILEYASTKYETHNGIGGAIDLIPLKKDPKPEWLEAPWLPFAIDTSKSELGYEPPGYEDLS